MDVVIPGSVHGNKPSPSKRSYPTSFQPISTSGEGSSSEGFMTSCDMDESLANRQKRACTNQSMSEVGDTHPPSPPSPSSSSSSTTTFGRESLSLTSPEAGALSMVTSVDWLPLVPCDGAAKWMVEEITANVKTLMEQEQGRLLTKILNQVQMVSQPLPPPASSHGNGVNGDGETELVTSLRQQLAEAHNDLEESERNFVRLATELNQAKNELNGVKHALIKASISLPDVIKTFTYGGSTYEEVKTALNNHHHHYHDTTRPGQRAPRVTKQVVNEVLEKVDRLVRDAGFDPFQREGGKIIGVDYHNAKLNELIKHHGRDLVELVVAKKREIDMHCPSGSYPSEVLWDEGKEAQVGDVVNKLVQSLLKARAQKTSASTHDHGYGIQHPTAAATTTTVTATVRSQGASRPNAATATARSQGTPGRSHTPSPPRAEMPDLESYERQKEGKDERSKSVKVLEDELQRDFENWLVNIKDDLRDDAKTKGFFLNEAFQSLLQKILGKKHVKVSHEDARAYISQWKDHPAVTKLQKKEKEAWDHLNEYLILYYVPE